MKVVRDFEAFVFSVNPNYHEVYDLYQAAKGDDDQCTFTVTKANHSNDDLIIYNYGDMALRLTSKAASYFPDWIEKELMGDMDAEGYWSMHYAMERDQERESRGLN